MLKIGLIGVGHLGRIHLEQLLKMPEYELVGIYDVSEKKIEEAINDYGVTPFGSLEELVAASDVVDIVTPTLSHYECAVMAIKNSKHAFIEKPITETLEEARELMELTREANVMVQIGHVERFNPAFMAGQKHCEDPVFIETHRLAEFNPRGTDVPVVLDLMIHDIDIVLSLVKSTVKKINASGVSIISDTPDIANARIEFNNGCVANLTASRISMKNMRKSRIFQRDAYITFDFLEKEVNVIKIRPVSDDEELNPKAVIIDTGKKNGKKQIYFDKPEIKNENAIRMELQALAHSIHSNTQPPVTIEDGYNALEVAHQILDKLKLSDKIY
jgi:hypothetical protein